jgi:metal-responsive CopG/Arc/MetJ family transcriptional regulator
MKTAISIPDPVFKSAEQLASRLRVSRSALYSKALKAFMEEHRDDLVTSRLNEVYGASENISVLDPDIASMQRRSIGRGKW